jgi:hypothetical protein
MLRIFKVHGFTFFSNGKIEQQSAITKTLVMRATSVYTKFEPGGKGSNLAVGDI